MSRNFQLLQRAELERKQAGEPEIPAAAMGLTDVSAIPADAKPLGAMAESDPEMMGLVHRLFLAPGERAPRCVVFIPASPQASSVCARAAETLTAYGGGTVCVVDAGFAAPSLHDMYGIENGNGFSDALTQNVPLESYAHRVEASGLTVIPAGEAQAAWKGSFASEAARKRLTELRSRFDFVLIEAPAYSSMSSAVLLGQQADGAVVVVEAGTTRREAARRLVDELTSASVHVLGAVLNNRSFPIPEKLYRVF